MDGYLERYGLGEKSVCRGNLNLIFFEFAKTFPESDTPSDILLEEAEPHEIAEWTARFKQYVQIQSEYDKTALLKIIEKASDRSIAKFLVTFFSQQCDPTQARDLFGLVACINTPIHETDKASSILSMTPRTKRIFKMVYERAEKRKVISFFGQYNHEWLGEIYEILFPGVSVLNWGFRHIWVTWMKIRMTREIRKFQ